MSNVTELSDEELKKNLITLDYRGMKFKQECLNELLKRNTTEGKQMNESLNPVESTVELQPTVLTEAGGKILVAGDPVPEQTIMEGVQTLMTTGQIPGAAHTVEGEIPSLDNLTEEQQSQLRELQKRMELYNKSRSGHHEGDTHKFSDGVSYLVTKSGAYNRIGNPRKSRKATHRKEVASRRAGKS